MFQKKPLIIILIFLCLNSYFFSASKSFRFGSSTLETIYDDVLYQGDPVFIKLRIESPFIQKDIEAIADIVEVKTGKKIRQAKMYPITNNSNNFFVGLPLSTYVNSGSYTINIKFKSNALTETISMPIEIKTKNFVSETIPLDPVNTAIKTDTSEQRMTQIDTLNAILNTINSYNDESLEAFTLPVLSTRRTSFFGDRRIFAYSNGASETSLHYGIDFGVPIGTEVFSCGKGRVVMSEMRNSTGWTIVIEHLPGLYSLYYHLDEMLVKKGDIVSKKQLIALSGKTGLATGPHLHWEIRLLAEAVNPDYFVEKFALFN